jgi:heme exporter protein C
MSSTWKKPLMLKYYRFASLPKFYQYTQNLPYRLALLTSLLLAIGLYGAMNAPKDAVQGETFRLIYVHVPNAILSLTSYLVLTLGSLIFLIWRIKLADIIASVAAYLGLLFTLLALITGSIWGKPMWGTWWIWDARLTSELILLFLYLGYISLRSNLLQQSQDLKPAALLAIIGSIDLPIIHYSVQWWATLHQGPTLMQWNHPTIATSMLWPLLLMIAAYFSYFLLMLLLFTRQQIITNEHYKAWVARYFSA